MKRSRISCNYDSLLGLYSSEGVFLLVNKQLLKRFGPEKAIFLANLVDKLRYFRSKGMTKDNWFFQSHENQMSETGLSEYSIRKCKSAFKIQGILKIKKKGLPAREWYYLDIQKLDSVLQEGVTKGQDLLDSTGQGIMDSTGQAPLNSTGHKENKIKENKIKENKIKKYDLLLSHFTKDWQEDRSFQKAIKEYCQHRKEKGNSITPLSAKRTANKLEQYSLPVATKALNKSVENGWTGVFPESVKNNSSPPKPHSNQDQYAPTSSGKDYCKNVVKLNGRKNNS